MTTVRPSTCAALLVVDAQESFRQLDSWSEISDVNIASRIAELVEHARGRGELVVWILHSEPGSGGVFDPARGYCRFLEGLQPNPDEPTIRKTSINAFTTTNLAQLLTSRGVRRIRVTGIRTEQCCETTARVASDLGYEVQFVLDATATHPLRMWDGSGVLPVDVVQARTASALAGRFATVVTAAEVLAR